MVYLSFFPLLLASLFSAIWKTSSDSHFAFLHYFFLGMVLITASYIVSQTSIHSSSGTLSTRSNPLNLFVTSWICYVIPEWSSGFPCFLQFKSEGNKEFMIWATVSFWSCFCWLYRASPSLAVKNITNLILILTVWWCPCVESSLVLLQEGVSMTSAFSWQNSVGQNDLPHFIL